MKFTEQQEKIFQAVQDLSKGDHLKIMAYAGSGKTTTLVEAQKRDRKRAIYCPFNKGIADEAARKFAGTMCVSQTMHSIAWGVFRDVAKSPYQSGAQDIKKRGLLDRVHAPKVHGWGEYRLAAAVNRALSNFCISADTEITEKHAVSALTESVGDPEFLSDAKMRERAEETIRHLSKPVSVLARIYMEEMIEHDQYSHDVYVKMLDLNPNLLKQAFMGYQRIYKDEAQDTNPVEMSILMKSGISVISVGDAYQQIYSWRGAENALDNLPGKVFYLSDSFRFGLEIAQKAMAILSARPDGGPSIPLTGKGDDKGRGKPRNAIICRTNAGVLDEAERVMSKGAPYYIDNANGLISDLMSVQAIRDGKKTGISGNFAMYNSWEELLTEASEGDKSLMKFVKIVEEDRTEDMVRLISSSQKTEDTAKVILMTGHRSKGREFPFVRLGKDWKPLDAMRSRWAKEKKKSKAHETRALEEYNALYVSVTRAETRIYGVDELLVSPKKRT